MFISPLFRSSLVTWCYRWPTFCYLNTGRYGYLPPRRFSQLSFLGSKNSGTRRTNRIFISIDQQRGVQSSPGEHKSTFLLAAKDDTDTILGKSSSMLPQPRHDDVSVLIGKDTRVQQVLHESIAMLERAGIDEPVESVVQILSMVLGLSWQSGYRALLNIIDANPPQQPKNLSGFTIRSDDDANSTTSSALEQQRLDHDQIQSYIDLLQRRLQSEPIQYIVGQWDFLDYVIKIRPPLLCPRPETEELVMLVYQDILQLKQDQHHQWNILDIGCGTGCIGIALCDKLPTVNVTAIDVDPVAIETSTENSLCILGDSAVDRYHTILCSAEDYSSELWRNEAVRSPLFYDVVVSNPPYIPEEDLAMLSPTVINYESRGALNGGTDGMDIIRVIVRNLSSRLCRPGAVCWMEVDPTHPKLIRDWLLKEGETLGVQWVSSHPDMFGYQRFVKLLVTR